MSTGNKPDFRVGALNRETDEKNSRVGGAWKNPDGTIDLRLDDFITITGSKSLYLRLWPNADQPYTTKNLAAGEPLPESSTPSDEPQPF